MGRRHDEVYVHLVWGTWDREPLLTEALRPRVLGCIRKECSELGAMVVALNGVDDHVHLLVRLPTTVAVATLVKQVKGASSHLANHVQAGDSFKWQGYYGAFSVSPADVARITNYIDRQQEHHRANTADPRHEPAESP